MRHTLLSQFQGALLGAVLGDEIGSYWQTQSGKTNQANLLQWRPRLGDRRHSTSDSVSLSPKGTEVIDWATALVRYGSLNNLAKYLSTDLAETSKLIRHDRSIGDVAIATLPLALFCHDSEIKRRQALELAIAPFQEAQLAQVFTFGYGVAQLLQAQWNAETFMAQIIQKIQQSGFSLTVQQGLTEWLDQVQQCLRLRMSLKQAIVTLTPSPSTPLPEFRAIALAFYCFLSSPDHFTLALLRAAQAGYQPATVAALTGTLAGIHNSIIDIPLEWHLVLADSTQPLIWGISGVEIQTLATRLLTSWSGMYDAASDSPTTVPPIAAPGVIRPR